MIDEEIFQTRRNGQDRLMRDSDVTKTNKKTFIHDEKETNREKAGHKCNGSKKVAISWLSRGREISASVS